MIRAIGKDKGCLCFLGKCRRTSLFVFIIAVCLGCISMGILAISQLNWPQNMLLVILMRSLFPHEKFPRTQKHQQPPTIASDWQISNSKGHQQFTLTAVILGIAMSLARLLSDIAGGSVCGVKPGWGWASHEIVVIVSKVDDSYKNASICSSKHGIAMCKWR